MILTFLLLTVSVCAVFILFVLAENAKRNGRSPIRFTDTESLEYRQMIFDKIDKKAVSNKEKPKSNLRGVKKRYQKV